MKHIVFLAILLLLSSYSIYSQNMGNRKYDENLPILMRSTNHDPNFVNFPEKSFYKSRNNWQEIIDSTWGQGLPLATKINIFNQYTNILRNEFDGFESLGMSWNDWDNLRNQYFVQLNDSTSRGRFCAIMNYLSADLRDGHTYAGDEGVIFSPLNPGVPVLFAFGFIRVEHFGAVVSVLPDSSVLVLRTVKNHPLGLQPGDIIFGYEGIPYKILIQELMEAGLPGLLPWIGAESARAHHRFIGAGMNWHLFNTIDILKYATGDTLHLSLAPMINLNVEPMLNNEQIEIPGIPFPDYFNEQLISYGILDNTNIGYIYLFSEFPRNTADRQFAQAVNALKNTEGLIIDMRWNEGGGAFFHEAFNILFNESPLTIEDAHRCSPSTLDLCPVGNAGTYQIMGASPSLYDHPIAVLLGPICVSHGDVTAQRFRYHPTAKFFGKPPVASLGDNLIITDITDWFLRYSIGDMFHVNQSGDYLNRTEFPIDFPVWHNANDVANGIDAVVEKARFWINTMIYAHDVKQYSTFVRPLLDTLKITAKVKNPSNHNIDVAAIIALVDSVAVDSLPMFDDGNHGDNLAGDGLYGCFLIPLNTEDFFSMSASVTDLDSSHYHILTNASRFTSVGPVQIKHYELIGQTAKAFGMKFEMQNQGLIASTGQLSVSFASSDTHITAIIPNHLNLGTLTAGESRTIEAIAFHHNGLNDGLVDTVDIRVDIFSDDIIYWHDSVRVILPPVTIDPIANKPLTFNLQQNYPNPFNPTTTIEFSLPHSGLVTLKVFNTLGAEVTKLVSEKLSAGSYRYNWDAGDLASGVYFYRIEASGFSKSRKMLLIR